ncbi:GtrA family protein [Candidatus Parcubacteria bacterium]|nr:GtrA family protein [Candidatus Parcubacteria bacterium]
MKLLKNRHPKRFLKFSIIGVVNFFVDLVILNLLSYVTGFNKGFYASVFSALSFFIANINSYFLNRRWTFKSNNKDSGYKAFLAISLFGVLVNIFVVFILTTFVQQNYFSDIIWLNISKFVTVFFISVINYFGYKKYVFNR